MPTARASTDTMKSETEPLIVKPTPDEEPAGVGGGYRTTVLEVALDAMVKKAYPHHSINHAAANVQMMSLDPDVTEALLTSIKRVTA